MSPKIGNRLPIISSVPPIWVFLSMYPAGILEGQKEIQFREKKEEETKNP